MVLFIFFQSFLCKTTVKFVNKKNVKDVTVAENLLELQTGERA